MAAVCVRICRFISFLNLLFILQFYTVWQPKGLCDPIMTKFNAKASIIKNNQELKFPRRPISIWYKHGPTCLVLPIDLTVHMDVELNPGPLQKKPIHLLTCLPAISVISGLVSYTSDKLLSTNYADTRHVGFCGSYYSDFYHRFSYRPCSLPLLSTYRRCRAGRRIRRGTLGCIRKNDSNVTTIIPIRPLLKGACSVTVFEQNFKTLKDVFVSMEIKK